MKFSILIITLIIIILTAIITHPTNTEISADQYTIINEWTKEHPELLKPLEKYFDDKNITHQEFKYLWEEYKNIRRNKEKARINL